MPDYYKMEKNEAKRDGAKPTKNSGRGIQKADARLHHFSVDYKHAEKSFTINADVWAKICMDARSNDLSDPALKVILGEEDGPKTRLWIVEDDMFHQMLEAYVEQNKTDDDTLGGVRRGTFNK